MKKNYSVSYGIFAMACFNILLLIFKPVNRSDSLILMSSALYINLSVVITAIDANIRDYNELIYKIDW